MPHIHHNALLTRHRKISNSPGIMIYRALTILCLTLTVASCGESSNKPAAPASPPIHMACTTPEQAGLKAADITRKLVEQKKAGTITQDEYAGYNNTLGQGLRAWAERQDLKAYCAALDRVVKDAGLK
jgi:hypothetical protein